MRLAGFLAATLSFTSAAVHALPQPYLPGVEVAALTGAEALVAADFDGDGDLDLAAGGQTAGGELIWVEATPTGWVRHVIASGLNRPVDLAAGDLDCDGDPDLVVALDTDAKVDWYRNTNAATSWVLGGTLGTGAGGVQSVAIADLNRDGNLDVVAALNTDDEIVRFRNNSCASSWNTGTLISGLDGPADLAVADLNGDGRDDVVAAVQNQDLVAFWANPGGGGGWSQVTLDAAFDGASSVSVGDIDGDGDLDVAGAANGADQFVWWANPGPTGAWTKTPIGAQDGALVARLVDLDRDGDLDLMASAPLITSPTGWYENTTGTGGLWVFHELEVGLRLVPELVAFDFGQDGDLDLALAADSEGEIRLYENSSTHRGVALGDYGSLSYLSIFREVPDWEMGDVNDDGLPDLVLIDRDSNLPDAQVYWQPNVGLGPQGVVSFGFEPALASVSTHLYEDLALGDLDGDGDLDILIGESESVVFALTLCRNQLGTIPPWSCGPVVTSFWKVEGLGIGDLDGDGDLDVSGVVTNTSGGTRDAVWWELDAGATSWTLHNIDVATNSDITDTRPIDFDGDGDLDVVTNANTWWRSDGIGLPTWVPQFLLGPVYQATDFGDIDRDGDLDAVGASETTAGWLENNLEDAGTFTFRGLRRADADSPFDHVRLADLDLDGDPDLVAGLNGLAGDRLVWFENNVAAGFSDWAEHPLAQPQNIPAQGARIFTPDLDHDGDPDVLAGRDAGFYASWVNGGGQYTLESRSIAPPTIGPGVEVALLALDATHRGRGGEAAIELATLALTFEETGGGPLASSELADLVTVFRLYEDDGSGSFNAALDTEVAELTPPLLSNGLGKLVFADGVPALALAPEAAATTYFLTAELTPTALNVGISELEVSHEPALGTVAENVLHDTPATREAGPGATASFTLADPFLFADGFESGNTSAWTLVFP